jgi:hypothetical protein
VQVAGRLSSALGRKDQGPNVELGQAVGANRDAKAMAELVGLLAGGTRAEAHDAVKAIDEAGSILPDLLAPHLDTFFGLLEGASNRMKWGLLGVLVRVIKTRPEVLMVNIDTILATADQSTVIAKDRAMKILSALAANPRYYEILTPVYFNRLRHSAVNQFATYAEIYVRAVGDAITPDDRIGLRNILLDRQGAISFPARKKRIQKLLKALKSYG